MQGEMQPVSKSDGSGSTQAQGGMSRAETSRARLAAQRERLAQQRARLSAGGTRANSIQRSESGASVQSTLSSMLDQPAQQERGPHVPGLLLSPRPAQPHDRSPEAPRRQALEPLPRPATGVPTERLSGSSDDDRRLVALQGRGSGASDGSRGSGLPSPGGPRSRSAAIDVPTSPHRVRRSPRYTPYEDDPYLSKMGAPPVVDPVPAQIYAVPPLPGQGKAAREPLELSPVPEVINTGFASIDSKQKASQRFSIPGLLSQGDLGPPAAEEPAAQAPRRKKKEEGSMPPRLKPSLGKDQALEQSAAFPSPSQRSEALLHSTVNLSGRNTQPSSAKRPALPLGSAPASGKETTASQQTAESFLQLPGSQPVLSTSSGPPGDGAAAPGFVEPPAPSLPAQRPEAAPNTPHFPAFGSLIPPVLEDSVWQSAPAAASEGSDSSIKAHEAGQLQDKELHGPATDMPFSAPAGEAPDTDFWASAGQHAEAAMQQPDLASEFLEEQEKQSMEEWGEQQQQQPPLPPRHSAVAELSGSSAPASDFQPSRSTDSASPPVASMQGSNTQTDHHPATLPGPSSNVPSPGQHGEPQSISRNTLMTAHGNDCTAAPQGAQVHQAPILAQASNPFGAAEESCASPLDEYASPFPSGHDEDTSFFEGLGAPGHADLLTEPVQAPSQERSDGLASSPTPVTASQSWQPETQHIMQGQQGPEQMQTQGHSTEAHQQYPQWDMQQDTWSSTQQQAVEAPLQQGIPFGQPQGPLGGYGQAALDQGPFSTAAAPEHNWEPQPAGVLNATAWPSEDPNEAPRQDPYASGGQNYYGAGWQADAQARASETSEPARRSGSGWGKLGFWGGGQPAEEPAQTAPDEGVLYYGASEVHAASPALTDVHASEQPAQKLYGAFQPPPFTPAAQPQQGTIPSGPPPFTRPQPPPPVYAQSGHPPAAHIAQPVHLSSEPAQHPGSSIAPPMVRQQAPWQPSAQGISGQQQASQQDVAPWLQSRPGSSAQSSHAQPQLAGNEQSWHGSEPLNSPLQHQQEAAGPVPWQGHTASAFPPATGPQHAETAPSGALGSAWGPGGDASIGNTPQAEPEQAAHLDDQMQPLSHLDMAAQVYDGQGAHAELPGGATLAAGPFGAADASEADFWGQHDAEVLSEGPFASTATQHGELDDTHKPEEGLHSTAAAWGDNRPTDQQNIHDENANSAAEASADKAASHPSSEAIHAGAVSPSQGPLPFAETQAMPAVEQQPLQLDSAQDSTPAAGQPGPAQHDAAPAGTPFGSEAAQSWQMAGSAALPLPSQPPPSLEQGQPGSAEGPQDWVASQQWGAGDSSGAHRADQAQHLVPEDQPADTQQVFQEHPAWLQSLSRDQPEAQAGGSYASYGAHGGGEAGAVQHQGDLQAGQYAAAGQHAVLSWQAHQPQDALGLSNDTSLYQHPSMAWQDSQVAGNGHHQDTGLVHQQSASQQTLQPQAGQVYVPSTAASSGALFRGGQNLWTAQQRRVPSDADAGLVPGSAAEAIRVAHGRPPCGVIAFGIGGRVAVLKPVLAHGHGGKPVYANLVSLDSRWMPGQLSITRMGSLAAFLGSFAGAGQVGTVDEDDYLMQQFPGPLTPAVPKEKVLAFLEAQAAACVQFQSSIASTDKAMWGVLRILASYAGSLRVTARLAKGKPDESLGAELAAVLAPSAGNSASLMPAWQAHGSGMAPLVQGNGNGHAAALPGAADTMQKLLLEGRKAEALRTAVESGLWGPALILAHASGDLAYAETAAAMAAATAGPGSPLATVLLMLAGGHDLVLPAKPSAHSPPANAASGSSFNLKGLLNKSASKADVAEVVSLEAPEPPAAELAMLADWRTNLAMLASYMASSADEALIVRLGDRLWEQQGQVGPAHLCYLVGGMLPQVYEAGARICLLGADHRGAPHSLASLPALQRTEVLEWAKLPGMAQPAQLALPLLPYKLLYAYKLAEYGHLTQALQYLGLVRGSLGSLGNKMPAALLVCNGMAADLEQRLRAHAAAFNVSVKASQSSSFIGGLGRLLDKGINRLISGDLPPSGPPSTGSDTDPYGRQLGRPADSGSPTHRRSGSLQHNGAITPVASFKDLASASQQAFAQGGTPALQNKSGGSPTQQAPSRQAPAAQQNAGATVTDPAASGPPSSGPSSIRSIFSGLGGLLGASLAPPKKEAKLGAEENTFFYDEERKMWRERGAEIPAAAAPLPPPPTVRMPSTPGPSAGPPPPVGQTRPGSMHAQEVRGASSRYVNTMTSSSSNRSPSTMLPPLVPPAPSGAAAKPPSSFFVPPPAAQRPAPVSSPAQELASQPFDTGTPAQILAEESPLRDDPQAAFPITSQATQSDIDQPADRSRPGEGRRSSGFGQWLNNGANPTESQAGAAPLEAPGGPAAQPGSWQGLQLYGQAAPQQPWEFQTSQAPARHEPSGGDIFTAYASTGFAKPAQQTIWPNTAQGAGGTQQIGLPSVLGPSFPARAGTSAIDSEEMKEIEL